MKASVTREGERLAPRQECLAISGGSSSVKPCSCIKAVARGDCADFRSNLQETSGVAHPTEEGYVDFHAPRSSRPGRRRSCQERTSSDIRAGFERRERGSAPVGKRLAPSPTVP